MSPLRKVKTKAIGAARSRGLELRRVPRIFADNPEAELKVTLDHLIAHRTLEGDPELFVVQVGAFDGKTDDPIHRWITRYGWSGVLIEPQRRWFNKLQETYEGFEKLSLRNVAINRESGGRPLYSVEAGFPGVPQWVSMLASFDPATILAHKHLVPNIEELIRSEEVECVTFHQLLGGVEHVDLLQVDAEGYDAEIIRMFDFNRWRPSIVNFERVHLSSEDHESVMRLLVSHGYRVTTNGYYDTVAYAAEWNERW